MGRVELTLSAGERGGLLVGCTLGEGECDGYVRTSFHSSLVYSLHVGPANAEFSRPDGYN
eukprot:1894864-Ditylum_brightwellii.AAC.1